MRVSWFMALTALTLACGGGDSGTEPPPPPPPPPNTATVSTPNATFSPDSVRIAAGGTVTWNIQGIQPHNVVFVNATPFPVNSDSSGIPVTSGTFTGTFPTPGTYLYYCRPHGQPTNTNPPGVTGMSGKVVVE